MRLIKRIFRLRKILSVCRKYRLADFLPDSFRYWKALLIIVAPFSIPVSRSLSEGVRLRMGLTVLGPIFIKFGQLLSTRRDLLPTEIADALAQLQDQVDPFCGKTALQITEQALEQSLDSIFSEFQTSPLASASVAQVHSATLISGEEVVVKVLRPGIQKIIDADLILMSGIAHWLETHINASHRFKPVEVIDEYQHTILDELDLKKEAANTIELRRNWKNSQLLYVPKVYWDFCHKNILVMERIYGIPVSDIEALKAAGTNMKVLSERGVDIFFTQVFKDSFFHADMHPGNIFVDVTNPEEPKYIAIDCGIMGTLNSEDQRYLAENFIAFFNRDYQMVAKLHIESGWIPPGSSEADFEATIRNVCEPIFGKPLSEISFGTFLISLFQTARRFDMPVQPQLVLLQKTFLYVEGLGRQLYPELDLWQTAKPYLENWMKERMSPETMFKEIKRRAPFWREKLPEIPDLIYHALTTDRKKHLLLEQQVSLLSKQIKEQNHQHKSTLLAVLGLSSLVSGLILNTVINNFAYLDSGLMIVGVILLISSLKKR